MLDAMFETNGVRYELHREPQVLRLRARDPFHDRLSARPRGVAGTSTTFVGAALLAHKAKQVDDGIVAALELAAQRGAGTMAGKYALLHGLLAHLKGEGEARATLDAASSLGGEHPCSPGRATAIRDAFLRDPFRSKPLGFYSWSDELSRLFRQDRLLQSDLSAAPDLGAVVDALRGDPRLRADYEASLRLSERLTNGLVCADLRPLLGSRGAAPARPTAFFPPSRSHETELLKRLYGDAPLPEDFDLAHALVASIRSGEIDLTPSETSGWYDIQTWALETLAAPERAVEAKKLELDESYCARLEDLFRAAVAATRETHAKQLEGVVRGGASPRQLKLFIGPQLTVEPLVTYYQRRADSYRFVRAVIIEVFGEDALSMLHGLRPSGPLGQTIGHELTAMMHLFDGAAATAMRELGMPTEWDTSAFEGWRGGAGDPDVDADLRMMLPLFDDLERRQTKVWMLLGWSSISLDVSFATPPRVELLGGSRVNVELTSESYTVPTPVMVEAYVSRLLDRDAFRAHCEKHVTVEAILAGLTDSHRGD